jgi:hypothetical protein
VAAGGTLAGVVAIATAFRVGGVAGVGVAATATAFRVADAAGAGVDVGPLLLLLSLLLLLVVRLSCELDVRLVWVVTRVSTWISTRGSSRITAGAAAATIGFEGGLPEPASRDTGLVARWPVTPDWLETDELTLLATSRPADVGAGAGAAGRPSTPADPEVVDPGIAGAPVRSASSPRGGGCRWPTTTPSMINGSPGASTAGAAAGRPTARAGPAGRATGAGPPGGAAGTGLTD